MEGYDTMLIGNLFAQPAFKKHYGQRTAKGTYQIPAPWQAGLKNGADCGCIVGLLLAGYVSERLGFRKTMLGGLALISAFIFIQFFAPSIEVLLVAQILFGIPLGLFQTLPIVYAAEIAPVSLRPYLTNYVNICWGIGHVIGSGILRGSLQIEGQWAYRVTFAIQWIWPSILIPLLFFAPENPRWLVRRGRLAEAKKSSCESLPAKKRTSITTRASLSWSLPPSTSDMSTPRRLMRRAFAGLTANAR
ncbi:unnamed protein product [Zymoseptoria tritici ST99CH_1A5]|uniref:Major facilitator superfamily (MFS) profile domain-containing protein n=1 Tax=Zymoseptoria tritici ST99CH_1A5 TaxID=1276529 RepID=A0A1Y6LW71_ZYMTR|nr:unnamed protein product [Zymoseptoria tritici ST99CH_1A5]